MHQHNEHMQKIIMLTPYLLTKFHSFDVYSMQGLGLRKWSIPGLNCQNTQMCEHHGLTQTETDQWIKGRPKPTQKPGRPAHLLEGPRTGSPLSGQGRNKEEYAGARRTVRPKDPAGRPHGGRPRPTSSDSPLLPRGN